MTEIILSVTFITPENLAEAERIYSKKDVYSSKAGYPLEYAAGKVIVTRTIHTPDLFSETWKFTNEHHWLATREEFDAKFNVVNDGNRTDQFALITQK